MKKLVKARERKGMTRRQLADAAGVSYVAVFRYETGKRQPTARILLAMARALGCKPEELVDDD